MDDFCENSFNCVANRCSGLNKTVEETQKFWNKSDCISAYSLAMNTNFDNNIFGYSEAGLTNVQTKVEGLFKIFLNEYSITSDIHSSEYNNFQNNLLDLCLSEAVPGACQSFLTDYCSKFTRDQVSKDSILTNFCGCYVPPDEAYLQYALGNEACLKAEPGCVYGCIAGTPDCVGQPACDPLCHRSTTSHKSNPETGNIINCTKNICAITNTSIKTFGSEIGGSVNFNSVCPGCGDGTNPCLCIVSESDNFKANEHININLLCGSQSVCITQDSDGNILSSGSCKSVEYTDLPSNKFYNQLNWGMMIIIIIVFIIIIIIIFFTNKKRSN